MTASLHTIAVFVTDIDRPRKFYEECLRLPLVASGSFGAQYLEGPPFLGVHPAGHPSAQAMVGRETGLTFRVDDLIGFRSELADKGVHFLTEPVQQGFGMMAMVSDPDGNVFALWEDNVTPATE